MRIHKILTLTRKDGLMINGVNDCNALDESDIQKYIRNIYYSVNLEFAKYMLRKTYFNNLDTVINFDIV